MSIALKHQGMDKIPESNAKASFNNYSVSGNFNKFLSGNPDFIDRFEQF